ncbi:MAG: hypothetical protein ABIJ96_04625 [Elusimicrobiota bacterium]
MLKSALMLLLFAAPVWSAGVISGDKPVSKEKRGRGDIQVGPDVEEKRPLTQGKSRPGIYPVYEAGGRWMLVDREPQMSRRRVRQGSLLAVIGSSGVDVFRVGGTTRTWIAACEGRHPVPRTAYLLTAGSAKKFAAVGTPIIALLLPKGKTFDKKRSWFYPLRNEVKEQTYQKLQDAIRAAVVSDLRSGAFQIDVTDEKGHAFAKDPDPQAVQFKIDFGSKIRYLGFADAFVLVEGTQISQTYRRCLRMFNGIKPMGDCEEMPHELNVETRQMQFVAYDPNRRGRPYIFAYTKTQPLWGHERWGFRITDQGPELFMRDALDPRCRAGF